MKISISDIKQLRNQTNAPVMECKKALEESSGDSKKAKNLLKKWGLVRAKKKADRETKEGRIFSYLHHSAKIGAMVEIECETDFVSRNQEFEKLGNEIAMQIASMKPKNVKALLSQEYIRDPKLRVADLVKQAIAKLGENIVVKRFERLEIGE